MANELPMTLSSRENVDFFGLSTTFVETAGFPLTRHLLSAYIVLEGVRTPCFSSAFGVCSIKIPLYQLSIRLLLQYEIYMAENVCNLKPFFLRICKRAL